LSRLYVIDFNNILAARHENIFINFVSVFLRSAVSCIFPQHRFVLPPKPEIDFCNRGDGEVEATRVPIIIYASIESASQPASQPAS